MKGVTTKVTLLILIIKFVTAAGTKIYLFLIAN